MTCPGLSDVAPTFDETLRTIGLSRKPGGRLSIELRQGEGGRDSLKVAQYEVLRNDAKRRVRPVRDDRNVRFGLARRSAIASIGRSFRPGRIALQER